MDKQCDQSPLGTNVSAEDASLSLPDIARRRSRPIVRALYGLTILAAIIAPYWLGRFAAAKHTQWLVTHVSMLEPRGVVLVSWAVTVIALSGLGLMIVEAHNWAWRVMFVLGLAAEQGIAGLCLLKTDFWYSTYVVYGEHAGLANAANLGIIAAGLAVAVYAVVFVGLLVTIRKDCKLNVLTRSWASMLLFYAIEVVALLIVMFGGLLTTV